MAKKLIVGLGNPGKKYENTNHNVGFMYLDNLALKNSLSWNENSKFKSLLCSNDNYIFCKPLTYMNLSGSAVSSVSKYYDVSVNDILIVHDDVDLAPLSSKFVFNRGAGGHHGVEDIIAKLGTKEFYRLRLGIGRPAEKKYDVSSYVLSKVDDELKDYILNLDLENFGF